MFVPAYQPLFEPLLAFIAEDRFREDVIKGRGEYVRHTGETFEEDRSYEYRIQGFLDWFIFDRSLVSFGEPPVLVFPRLAGLSSEEIQRFRVFGRTVHGLFVVQRSGRESVDIVNVVTDARYDVIREPQIAGLARGELFEGRIVPFAGKRHFSPAFLFHPGHVRRRLRQALQRQKKTGQFESVQEIIFTLARMAARAEHYRNVAPDAIYDFEHPPPKIEASRLKFDAESVERRLGRLSSHPTK